MGVTGLVCGLILAKKRGYPTQIARSQWLFTLILPLLTFITTLPSRPPFGGGHGFGTGFLLGGLGAALAGFLVLRAERRDESRSGGTASTLAITTPQSIGLLVSVAPLLWLRQNLLDTLLGVAIGWLCATFPLLHQGGADSEANADTLPLTAGIGFVATLCAAFALGELRDPTYLFHTTQRISWNMVGAILAAGIPFCLLLCALPNTLFLRLGSRLPLANPLAGTDNGSGAENAGKTIARFLRGGFGLVVFLALGFWLSKRLLPEGIVLHLVGAGAVTALIALAVAAAQAKNRENTYAFSQYHPLGLLLFAAGGMISYQWLQGFGIGIWLLTAWLVISLFLANALEDDFLPRIDKERGGVRFAAAQSLLNLTLFGAVLLLYRVTMARFSDDLHGANLTDQYALFGLLVGAFTPALLGGWMVRGDNRLFRLLPVALLALAIPGVALLLYGAKCALALLIGAALSFAFTSNSPSPATDDEAEPIQKPKAKSQNALMALALALALSQWTGRALDYALLAKAQKLHVLEAIGAALVLLILLADYGGRFVNRNQSAAGEKGANE